MFFEPETLRGARAMNRLLTFLHWRESGLRQKLAAELPMVGCDIPEEIGATITNLSNLGPMRTSIKRAKEIIDEADFLDMNHDEIADRHKKGFLADIAIDLNAPENAAFRKLALLPEILGPVSRYLGTFPCLMRISVAYSANEKYEGGSQLLHIDAGDARSIKCWICIDSVDLDSGPFTFLDKVQSRALYEKVKSWNGAPNRKVNRGPRVNKLPDEFMNQSMPDAKLTHLVGGPGTAGFVDTVNCYHYGSRPGSRPRQMMLLYYTSAFAADLPAFKNRGSMKLKEAAGSREDLMEKLLMFGIDKNLHYNSSP